ncbi:hypothetical protein BJY01DRAFT_256489 [Aspergillus pseudoustus]|uniref:Uncharacterized protein n=1 Tax=Aspergillus pseudoustus TaxID=1810923 RepID=A0ABR4I9C3_9EURO
MTTTTTTTTTIASTTSNNNTTTASGDAGDAGDNNETNSNGSSSSLSGGAIAGIAIGAVAFIILLALVWYRAKVVAWIHRATSPAHLLQSGGGSGGTPESRSGVDSYNYNPPTTGPPAELVAKDKGFLPPELSDQTAVGPIELSAVGVAELPTSQTGDLRKRS